MRIGRWLAAILAAVVLGGLVVGMVELAGMWAIPPSPEMAEAYAARDHARMAELMQGLPLASFLFVLAAYAGGALTAGFVAAAIAPTGWQRGAALMAASVLWFFGLLNLVQIPHPLWFTLVSLIAFHPPALLGCWLSQTLFTGRPDAAANGDAVSR